MCARKDKPATDRSCMLLHHNHQQEDTVPRERQINCNADVKIQLRFELRRQRVVRQISAPSTPSTKCSVRFPILLPYGLMSQPLDAIHVVAAAGPAGLGAPAGVLRPPLRGISCGLALVSSQTYMKVLLKNDMPIMSIQLGTIAKTHRTHPMGCARPYLAIGPSNGWK